MSTSVKILKWILVSLLALSIVIGILFYSNREKLFPPKPCLEDECNIATMCHSDSDCMVGCGCACVSTASKCPEKTMLGACPIGGLPCRCEENGVCGYSLPPE